MTRRFSYHAWVLSIHILLNWLADRRITWDDSISYWSRMSLITDQLP
jgi:hypothetical protein